MKMVLEQYSDTVKTTMFFDVKINSAKQTINRYGKGKSKMTLKFGEAKVLSEEYAGINDYGADSLVMFMFDDDDIMVYTVESCKIKLMSHKIKLTIIPPDIGGIL